MPTLHERSAGVILYSLPQRFLLLDYGKYWDYPKGHLEDGEDDRTAALRELQEETGITNAELDPKFRHEIAYFFRGRKGLIRKTVVFFLGRTDTQKVVISHEHKGYEWLDYEAARARLSYASAKQALEAAKRHLDGRALSNRS
jgi:8-oxo-dGTP pyrophosphatase MutT (NUDIX family)